VGADHRTTELSKITRCVLDGGSQTSIITDTLIEDLKLRDVGHKKVSAFESQPAPPSRRRLLRINVRGIWSNCTIPISAFESAHILSPQPAAAQEVGNLAHGRKIRLADSKTDLQEELHVEILIGGDSYWKVIKDISPLRLSQSLVLLLSVFGWVLSGNRSGARVNSTTVNFVHSDWPNLPPDDDLMRFWDLETIGITAGPDRTMSAKDSALLEEFHASFRIQVQRRVIFLTRSRASSYPTTG
jgi:hypothetical protein